MWYKEFIGLKLVDVAEGWWSRVFIFQKSDDKLIGIRISKNESIEIVDVELVK